jgi:hypothetical protein
MEEVVLYYDTIDEAMKSSRMKSLARDIRAFIWRREAGSRAKARCATLSELAEMVSAIPRR